MQNVVSMAAHKREADFRRGQMRGGRLGSEATKAAMRLENPEYRARLMPPPLPSERGQMNDKEGET